MPFQQITFSDLKTLAANRMGNASYYTSDELSSYINEAIKIWQLMAWYWNASASTVTVVDQTFYSTPATLLKPRRVLYGTTPLDPTQLYVMDQMRPGWQGDAHGTPKRWFPVGITQFGLHPKPETAWSLTVQGLARAPVLVNDGDYLDLGSWHVQPLLDYVEHLALFKGGGTEFQASIELYKNFVRAAADQNSRLKASGVYSRVMGTDMQSSYEPETLEDMIGGSDRSKSSE